MDIEDHGDSDTQEKKGASTQEQVISKLLQGKEKEWSAVAEKNGNLQLLDLPVDILKEIVNHVTHTNDLTSLALTHSAIHALAIPQIYSRFDIVWPDAHAAVDNRSGVDALTFGLATLVMAPDVFGESPNSRTARIRRGNNFAEHTRKFSLGNGPADWVSEYQINKESGKMLGTLVALTVGRMCNLETFVWDMPTGILRDIWSALASLGDRDDGQDCRLERLWVRWHDNSEVASPTMTAAPLSANPQLIQTPHSSTGQPPVFQIPPYPRVEFPTFSKLPPLKSLSVLDVDELSYIEEMSILVERSGPKLRELRLGVAPHAVNEPWIRPLEDQVYSAPANVIGTQHSSRPEGILGILLNRFCNASASRIVRFGETPTFTKKPSSGPDPIALDGATSTSTPSEQTSVLQVRPDTTAAEATVLSNSSATFPSDVAKLTTAFAAQDLGGTAQDLPSNSSHPPSLAKLVLEIFELERVPISTSALSRAIDWSNLNSLTLLGCRNHEHLWKALRRQFTPVKRSSSSIGLADVSYSDPKPSPVAGRLRSRTSSLHLADDYPLQLRRLHTDTVSPGLINFIKESLAPDSLEWLFLQDAHLHQTAVTIDTIFRNVIRRHRRSLKKLLIESEDKLEEEPSNPPSWRKWIFNRELLSFMTSNQMPKLRELGMAVDYRDWHSFLQRLPHATRLRSLYIPHISGHVNGRSDSRDLAHQVLDVVALRPELELCYLGIQSKCFEFLEYPAGRRPSVDYGSGAMSVVPEDSGASEDDDSDHAAADQGDAESDMASSRGGETDEEQSPGTATQFELREILFYDDKVSIFKARHGRL